MLLEKRQKLLALAMSLDSAATTREQAGLPCGTKAKGCAGAGTRNETKALSTISMARSISRKVKGKEVFTCKGVAQRLF